ncbi:MAG: hypothetical protein HUJ68_01330 [Clostridia bacterium]|nr:hypothetical protein [Clostridia bacterium]
MKTITLTIGELFDKLEKKYNVKFENNKFVNIDVDIKIEDESGNWVPINGFITKEDTIHEIKFDNGMTKKLGSEHLLSVEPFLDKDECTTRFVKDFEIGDDLPYLDTKCISNIPLNKETVYGFSVDSEKHLYSDNDGMIHHNTYTVTQTVDKYISHSGKKYHYECGALGDAITTVAPWFYKFSQGYIIVLDDNDKMIRKGSDIANLMKAVLDPEALDKPISVSPNKRSMKAMNDTLENLGESKIEFDTDALNESKLVIKNNGKVVLNEKINPVDAYTLNGMLRESEEEVEKKGGMPRSFVFNSSVIFVSNLELFEIDSAVVDRMESLEVKLTLEQFMSRLKNAIGGLCKEREYSKMPQWFRDWGKQCCYTALGIIIEAYEKGVTVYGMPVKINRKLTFRMFEEFVSFWCRNAIALAEEEKLYLSSKPEYKENLNIASQKLMKIFAVKKALPWLSKKTERF